MASNQSEGANASSGEATGRVPAPDWADGLKQLYDSVVEEALPDSFKVLLERLDSVSSSRGDGSGGADAET
jgi:hypothetical protein